MDTNERRLDRLEKTARDVVTVREAERVVGIWNPRHAANSDLWFYPTVGGAIAAECPWLLSIVRPASKLVRLICANWTAIVASRSKVRFHCYHVGCSHGPRSKDYWSRNSSHLIGIICGRLPTSSPGRRSSLERRDDVQTAASRPATFPCRIRTINAPVFPQKASK
jgi:hypothetical protein